MRSRDFTGSVRDFTPEEVRDRSAAAQRGPRLPGIGLAQWTSGERRAGLFRHVWRGRPVGIGVLTDLEAQVDYLVTELRRSFPSVNATLTAAGVSVDAASDDVVYRFEVPGSMLDGNHRRPREDAQVQAVFAKRRRFGQQALRVYLARHPDQQP
jgi:hypothetical protein